MMIIEEHPYHSHLFSTHPCTHSASAPSSPAALSVSPPWKHKWRNCESYNWMGLNRSSHCCLFVFYHRHRIVRSWSSLSFSREPVGDTKPAPLCWPASPERFGIPFQGAEAGLRSPAAASPATPSRCSSLWFSPAALGSPPGASWWCRWPGTKRHVWVDNRRDIFLFHRQSMTQSNKHCWFEWHPASLRPQTFFCSSDIDLTVASSFFTWRSLLSAFSSSDA